MTSSIAIVGMACLYPDAKTPQALWENVLAQRQAFRRIPEERLCLTDYWSAERAEPDRTYATMAAVIDGYEFDRVKFRVSGATYRTADLTHWLALDIASQALTDAGFADGVGLPRGETGVLLGNTLTGEFSRANLMRLRWPYVYRLLDDALKKEQWAASQRRNFLTTLEQQYKEPFPSINEDSLAGGLSNTIAGRICNYFDLHGGGYTVDGACASSLLAVTNACTALTVGDLDVALAGGVDLSLDPFELVGFAKTGALAPEEMRIYDALSAGFWPGEGCGFVVLMRYTDAVAQHRQIYAVIRGWGISSDGGGGLTRPAVEGQLLALHRAYKRAGFGIETVPYLEGHGTGTAVGDTVELQTLSRALREATESSLPPAVIGSIKANIGHTKAAAGIAGIIKAAMALNAQVLPPTTGCQTPHPKLQGNAPALRVLPQAEIWPAHAPLRAGVSAMGFGGINAHIVLEGIATANGKTPSPSTYHLHAAVQDAELFLLRAKDTDALQRQIDHLLIFAAKISRAELIDLAAELQRQLADGEVRAAIIATSPIKLVSQLNELKLWLKSAMTNKLDIRGGIFLGTGREVPRIGLLFPGQGTSVNGAGGALGRRFEFVQDLYAESAPPTNDNGVATEVIQPRIITATLAALRILHHLDIQASVAVGHSLGELSALSWAGALDEQMLLRIATERGRLMAKWGVPNGAMAQIGADHVAVADLLNGKNGASKKPTSMMNRVAIACLNSPNRTIISGTATAVTEVVTRAQTKGLDAGNIPVSHAFHSALMEPTVQPFTNYLAGESFHPLRYSVVSTVTGNLLASDTDLHALLQDQVTAPVRFVEAVTRAAAEVDLFIEVGSGHTLSALTSECTSVPTVAIDAGGSSIYGLLQVVGVLFALGTLLNHKALFADRFTRPFDLKWRPSFFVNPCELAPQPDKAEEGENSILLNQDESYRQISKLQATTASISHAENHDILSLVRSIVAAHVELPVSAFNDQDRLLSDLHLNSLTVIQLVAEAARRVDVSVPVMPIDFVSLTIADLAKALEESSQSHHLQEGKFPAGVEVWVRTFTVELIERPLPARQSLQQKSSTWQILGSKDHPLLIPLRNIFADVGGNGVVVCLPPTPDEHHIPLLMEGIQIALKDPLATQFVLVQHGGGAAALARTLHLERPDIRVCVVDVPIAHPQSPAWILAETMASDGYTEAHYNENGRRRVPILRLLPMDSSPPELGLGHDDVILVTGGGKGIMAECALVLAQATGVRVALLGRSNPEEDEELATNLERMVAACICFRYISADVTNWEAVERAVKQVETELGPITGILHGAASNAPQLLHTLDLAAFRRTLAPKVEGLRNLLSIIDPGQLRLFVTFGSIIARTGLPGEGDYALANEWLARLTNNLQGEYPDCRCLNIDWSVWAGAGMGDRLGILDRLVAQGIAPISLEDGTDMLLRLLGQSRSATAPSISTSVMVTGRFGEPPTLSLEKRELPFLRFLEQPRVYYPGIELVVDVELSVGTDPYLEEHIFQGEQLFPAVMGLEAMGQVAMALMESESPPHFEDVHFLRPIVVPKSDSITLRIAALLREPGKIEVILRSETNSFQAECFRGICRFGELPQNHLDFSVDIDELPPLALDPPRELYGSLLFHQGRFQRLRNYRCIAARHCIAAIDAENESSWFGRYLPSTLMLGDPGGRDAAIHAIQVCVPHYTLLPVGVEQMVQKKALRSTPCFMQARERSHKGDTFVYDVEIFDRQGRVLEFWRGLTLRRVGDEIPIENIPVSLLEPLQERKREEATSLLVEDSNASI